MNEVIEQVVLNYIKGKDGIANITKLYGDASYRTYFRAKLNSGRTLIVMKMPEGISSVSEEITNYDGPKDELPYINISNQMRALKLPVPEILFYDKERGVLILEDIGDQLLFEKVSKADEDTKFSWYAQAMDLLCLVQERLIPCGGCIAFKRSFDERLLNWEFDHFMEYGIEARVANKPGNDIKARFEELTRAITNEITKMKYIFTHRDYQSRNLMLKGSKLYIIDFQDALLGPTPYDLVALTRDSYVEISDQLLERLISYYCEKKGFNVEEFKKGFDLVTIHRKLKDAGRFVYIDRVKGNPNYLAYIPRSLAYVRKALMRQPKYIGLVELLKPYVPEWEENIKN